jgi:hypothetical protein
VLARCGEVTLPPIVEISTTTADLLLVTVSLLRINVSTDNTDNERYLT